MLIMLLKEPRAVSIEDAAKVVASELGQEAAATVHLAAENPDGMRYIDWRLGETPYHLGTAPAPYLKRIGVSKAGQPIRWTAQEEIPPREPRHCEAWMAHEAWMYVDALTLGRAGRPKEHRPNVLRIANHFIDDSCTLLWLWGGIDKHVSLPTPKVRAALANGRWLEE
jgi:hypothetical protein